MLTRDPHTVCLLKQLQHQQQHWCVCVCVLAVSSIKSLRTITNITPCICSLCAIFVCVVFDTSHTVCVCFFFLHAQTMISDRNYTITKPWNGKTKAQYEKNCHQASDQLRHKSIMHIIYMIRCTGCVCMCDKMTSLLPATHCNYTTIHKMRLLQPPHRWCWLCGLYSSNTNAIKTTMSTVTTLTAARAPNEK